MEALSPAVVEPGVCQRGGGGEEYGDKHGHTARAKRATPHKRQRSAQRFRVVHFPPIVPWLDSVTSLDLPSSDSPKAKARQMSEGERVLELPWLTVAGSGKRVQQNVASGNDVCCSGTVSKCVVAEGNRHFNKGLP